MRLDEAVFQPRRAMSPVPGVATSGSSSTGRLSGLALIMLSESRLTPSATFFARAKARAFPSSGTGNRIEYFLLCQIIFFSGEIANFSVWPMVFRGRLNQLRRSAAWIHTPRFRSSFRRKPFGLILKLGANSHITCEANDLKSLLYILNIHCKTTADARALLVNCSVRKAKTAWAVVKVMLFEHKVIRQIANE